MKAFSGYDDVKVNNGYEPLPVNAYIVKVRQVAIKNYDWGNVLCILYDIAEGEYSGYYKNDFDNQKEDKKWRGIKRVILPKDDGTEKDGWTKSTFKGMTTAFEESNPNYTWDWNENGLVGKTVGLLYRDEEWEYNGNHGWKAQPFRFMSASKVNDGNFKIPKPKELKGKTDDGFYPINEGNLQDDDLPF